MKKNPALNGAHATQRDAQDTCIAASPDAGSEDWWRGAVIYQIYPRSFQDSNGDGVGDLPGIISRLDYIASLGVDGIWLSPFFTSPMDDFGYDIADFCNVEPMFGDLTDFDRLVARAHELGLKVTIDQVYSHSSDQHPWFRESRASRSNSKTDWYVWADPKPDGSPPNNWQSVFGGSSWQWDSRRAQYYLHNFLVSQPDLNLHNIDVQDALLEVGRFWLERGVDGFRIDALNFCMHDPLLRDNPATTIFRWQPTRPYDFQEHVHNQSHPDISRFVARIRALTDEYSGRFTVAEVGGPFPLAEMRAFTRGEAHLNSAYSFEFLYAPEITAGLIRNALRDWPGQPGEGWPSWAFSNHDAPRAVSRWWPDCEPQRFARLLTLTLMSLRGNVFVYQGEELALSQADIPFEALRDPEAIANWPQTFGRDGARTPIPWEPDQTYAGFSDVEPWLPIDARHHDHAVARLESSEDSSLHFFREAMALRCASAALRTGELTVIDCDPELLVLERHHDHDARVAVINLTARALPLPERYRDAVGIDLQVGEFALGDSMLAGNSGFIARLKP